MTKGKISQWNDAKGFGFIVPIEGSKKIFFHVSDYPRGRGRPAIGQMLFFDVVKDARGDKAKNIELSEIGMPPPLRQRGWRAYLLAFCFVATLGFLAGIQMIPWWILWLYLVTSVVSFFAYGWDKVSAKMGAWRTTEATLQMLSLFCGWPGALIAQKYFKHKIKKEAFKAVFWVTVAINCGALALFLIYRVGSIATPIN